MTRWFLCNIVLINLFCLSGNYNVIAPNKVPNIPDAAIWAGGVDGGEWILCHKINDSRAYCKIYNDYNGEIWADGEFIVTEGTLKDINFTDKKIYDYYNGMQLSLKKGTVILRSVKSEF